MNQLMKGKTMEQTAEFNEKKKVAAQAYQARKKAAAEILKGFLASDEAKNISDEVKGAITYLTGTGQRTARAGVTSALKTFLLEGPKSLKEIFKKFEYGTPTMEANIKKFIKVTNPDDRMWVSFHDGVYEVMGQGATPPEGWTGMVPTEKTEL